MPCDRVYRTPVKIENTVTNSTLAVESVDLVVAALEAEGYSVARSGDSVLAMHPKYGKLTLNTKTGALRQEAGRGQVAQPLNAIKVAYSRKVIAKVATRFGWSLKEKANATDAVAVTYEAVKRGL